MIVDDFNVCFGTTDGKAVRVTDLLTSYGFASTIDTATRGHNCLDNIFINFSQNRYSASVLDTHLSDHLAQFVAMTADNNERGSEYNVRMVRPITTLGCFNFHNMMTNCSFSFLDNVTLGGDAKFDRSWD